MVGDGPSFARGGDNGYSTAIIVEEDQIGRRLNFAVVIGKSARKRQQCGHIVFVGPFVDIRVFQHALRCPTVFAAMADVGVKEGTTVHAVVDVRNRIGVTLSAGVGNLLIGIQIDLIEIDIRIRFTHDLVIGFRTVHEVVALLVIRHKSHDIPPVSEIGDLRGILAHQIVFFTVTNAFIYSSIRLCRVVARETTDGDIHQPGTVKSFIIIQ